MPSYNPKVIEPRWQQFWEEQQDLPHARRLPPSRSSTSSTCSPIRPAPACTSAIPKATPPPTSSPAIKRMRGFNVLHPMGWDAFGLPAEQYAIQTGTHPRITTQNNINTFRRQIKMLGFSYDWDREVDTTDPEYFKWTQWIFLELFDTWYDADAKEGPADQRAADPADVQARATRSAPTATANAWPIKPRCPSTGAPPWAPCWPTKKSSTANRSAAAIPSSACRCGNGCCASPIMPNGCSTIWPWSIGPNRSRRCSATGSARAKGRRSISRIAGSRDQQTSRQHPRLHDAARHALRRHLHGARPGASAGRSHHDARAASRR